MPKKLFLTTGILIFLCMMGANASPLQVKTRPIQGLYKTPEGLKQEIQIIIEHQGNPATAEISFNGKKQQLELKEGSNTCAFELDEIKEKQTFPVSVVCSGERYNTSVEVKPVRHWTINIVQHTHTDIGYTRSQMEILAEHLRYIDYALDYCDATDNYPEYARFKWTCEISWAVSEYLKCREKEQIDRLRKRINEGRIELGSMYLNFDEMPDEQTLAASLYPLKEFRRQGLRAELAMQDDVNGIGWCFSEYFADAGIKYLSMGVNPRRATVCFDKPTLFWWESPSGKRVLAYRGAHYIMGNRWGIEKNDFNRVERSVFDYLDEMQEKGYPYDVLSVQQSGYYTDNAPPSTHSSNMIIRWNEKYEWPKLRTAVVSELLKYVEKNHADKIPTIRGAWPDWWTDGFASGAREAAVSRITHSNIIASQGAMAVAHMKGAKLPEKTEEQINGVNEALLFYDEHTFGHRKSISNPYAMETWEQRSLKQSYAWEAYRRCGLLKEQAMGLLQNFFPRADVPSIAVFNTLNWTYSGIAKVYIDHQILPRNKAFEIVDSKGNVIPAQEGEHRADGTYWSLFLKDVPALGYAQYYIHTKDSPREPLPQGNILPQTGIENQWYKIEFNPKKGTISRLYDKELSTEILTGNPEWEMGEFIYEIMNDRTYMEATDQLQLLRRRPERIRFEAFESGAVWDAYRFRGETVAGRGPDNLMVEYRIYKVEKKIEVVYRLVKKAITDPEAVYISFPFEVKDGKIFFDVPGGSIEAGVQQIPGSANDWNTVQNFASARNRNGQVVMCSQEIPLMQFGAINTGRYEIGATPQSTNMYSWPMNNYWFTNFNADQMGETLWSYFITSSNDNSNLFSTRFAWSNRIPFLTRVLQAENGRTSRQDPASLFTIAPGNLLLVNMKPVKGERAAMLQLREISGQPAKFTITSKEFHFSRITVCDVLGSPIKSGLDFKPWETKFIKVSW